MRIAFLFFGLLLISLPMLSAGADRPTGKNCDLASPPAAAGEETNHGIVLRIYPRAKDIDSHYTGCQVLLAPDGKKWVAVSLTEVINGDPFRLWSAYEKDPAVLACRFKRGKVIKGDPNKCPAPEYILVKSLAPGCVRIIEDAVAKHGLGAPRPPECEYQ
jgi:hypothetical protein